MRRLRAGAEKHAPPPRLVAVVDIGTSAIRVAVAELKRPDGLTMVDRAELPIALGREVFRTGTISRELLAQCVDVLRRFREMLDGWNVSNDDTTVIATSALREARNRDTLIDRVELRTGFKISIIDGVEANRLTYVAVRDALEDLQQEINRTNSMIIEVGGGTTEVMVLRQGNIVSAHAPSIGTVRLEPQLHASLGSAEDVERIITECIRNTREVLDSELDLERIQNFIAVGSDARLAAEVVGRRAGERYAIMEKEAFGCFVSELAALSMDERVRKLRIPYADAESLVPALMIYRLFLEETSATEVIVPEVSIRDGVLLSLMSGPDPAMQKEFRRQVRASAYSLGRKYHFDEEHARHVAKLALSMFDQLRPDHGLTSTYHRLILQVAALLHDIGTYVAATGHHKHSQYLVANSEIFGLDKDDLLIISCVVRYHRKALPNQTHVTFPTLAREQRLVVMKLAAILRLADGLDRGHAQRVQKVTVARTKEEIILHCESDGDIVVERFGMSRKVDLFEQVFGMKVVLQ